MKKSITPVQALATTDNRATRRAASRPARRRQVLFVGLDVHKESISAAVLPEVGPVVSERTMVHRDKELKQYLIQLSSSHDADLVIAYEAGVCGYALVRKIRGWGYHCHVIAPNKIPQAPGDNKRKTDRRDAFKIARGLRAEELVFVRVPDTEDEATRDVLRLRRQLKQEQLRNRHHITKFTLRKGRQCPARNWTKAHCKWLDEQKFTHAAEQSVFDRYISRLKETTRQLVEIDKEIEQMGESPRYKEGVSLLRAYRGIEVLTAMVLLVEVGDFRRFGTAPELMSFQGLVPSEFSSGDNDRRGSITKAGNSYCRHALIQAAWQYRRPVHKTSAVYKRRTGLPEWVVKHAEKADKRLHKRYAALSERIKSQKVVVAVARELVGFLWATMIQWQPQELEVPLAI